MYTLLLLLYCSYSIRAQDFISSPRNVTTYEDQTVPCECRPNRNFDFIYWTLNGRDLDTDSPPLGINLRFTPLMSVLDIDCSQTYLNGSKVQCSAYIDDQFYESDTGEVFIQELLLAVQNIQFSNDSIWINITWDAPFSLNITDYEPDMTFRVEVKVHNQLLSRNHITSNHYNFLLNNPQHLDVYNFTVTVVDAMGRDGPSISMLHVYYVPDQGFFEAPYDGNIGGVVGGVFVAIGVVLIICLIIGLVLVYKHKSKPPNSIHSGSEDKIPLFNDNGNGNDGNGDDGNDLRLSDDIDAELINKMFLLNDHNLIKKMQKNLSPEVIDKLLTLDSDSKLILDSKLIDKLLALALKSKLILDPKSIDKLLTLDSEGIDKLLALDD